MMRQELLDILKHATGLDARHATPWRNHFVAGGRDVDACRELVALGCMREWTAGELTGQAPVFTVTYAGLGRAIANHSCSGDEAVGFE